MALEISEVGIRLRVGDAVGEGQLPPTEQAFDGSDSAREELVEDCVRRVLRVLKDRRER